MAWTAAQILAVRDLVNDEPASKQARAEVPQNDRDGSRLVFQLLHYPIVTTGWAISDTDATHTSVYLTSTATVRTQTGFTIDPENGLLIMGAAPAGTESPWYVDYYWQWFADTAYTNFLDLAAYDTGFSPSVTIPAGLTNAFYNYAKSHFFKKMSSKYAWRFNASGGGQGQQVDVVTKNYLALAEKAFTDAENMKSAYYTQHGAALQPALATCAYNLPPYTPIR